MSADSDPRDQPRNARFEEPFEEPFEELRVGSAATLLGEEPLDLSDLLNTVLDRGAVVHGEVTIAVADVDLIRLNIGLLLQAVATAEQRMRTTPEPSRSIAGSFGSIPRNAAPILAGAEPGRGEVPALAETQRPVGQSLNTVAQGLPDRINADAAGPETGLARLVLTLIEVLRKVLEHQAVRRMEGGRLTDEEVERLGLALAKLNDRMGELKRVFGLSEEDLQIDLGPLGRVR
ncbi:MAG TPA: gas vesicle protein GvpJ [Gemmatimonadaceae bacterium]|nr:gas vesicle protein GvpJ [Gemmatimonadaceae bacterium]